jgi:hypothetical protein
MTHRESRLRHCRFFFGYTPLDFARQESTAGHRKVEAALLEHRPFFKIIWSMQSQWSHNDSHLPGAMGFAHKGGVNP